MKAISKVTGETVENIKVVDGRYLFTLIDAVYGELIQKNLSESSFKRQYKNVEEDNEMKDNEQANVVVEGQEVQEAKAEVATVGNDIVAEVTANNEAAVVVDPMTERQEGEDFEDWITSTLQYSPLLDETVELDQMIQTKGALKVRDSARVAFLENKKSYERAELELESIKDKHTKEVDEERVLLQQDLIKYANRARKYYDRYAIARNALNQEKVAKKAAEAPAEQAEVTAQ